MWGNKKNGRKEVREVWKVHENMNQSMDEGNAIDRILGEGR